MLAFLWAEDQNHLIGQAGHLPWHLPNDLQYFKKVTWNHTIIMGHKTFLSLPHGPLPHRRNIVLSHNTQLQLSNVEVVCSKELLLKLIAQDSQVFIIGGSQVFAQFLDEVEYLYVTKIAHQFVGDVYMPQIDYSHFKLVQKQKGIVNENNAWTHEFMIYQRL
ncbi:MAG: dihydrofolate reductase [Lactobacillus sp.]|nr:dihydrofolate reductase [Lactobacillus sp.]